MRQMLIIRDPKATVPKWYLIGKTKTVTLTGFPGQSKLFPLIFYRIVRPSPWVNVKNGTLSLLNVQYHVANVAANTISPNAEMKNKPQKNPNTL